jgi:hypothetical protein
VGEHLQRQEDPRRSDGGPNAGRLEGDLRLGIRLGEEPLDAVVQPPLGETKLLGHARRLLVHHELRLEHRVHVARRATCVEGECDGRSAHHVELGLNVALMQAPS